MGCLVHLSSIPEQGEDLGGFWTSNGVGETIRDYIFKKAQSIHPEAYDRLKASDLAGDWWSGKLLDLRDVVVAAGSVDSALELLNPDDHTVKQVAAAESWVDDLRKYLTWTAMVLRGDIEGVCYILPDYGHLAEIPPIEIAFDPEGSSDNRLHFSSRIIRETIGALSPDRFTLSGFISERGPVLQVGGYSGRYVVEYKHDASSKWTLIPPEPTGDEHDLVVGARAKRFDAEFAVSLEVAVRCAWYFCIQAARDPALTWERTGF